MKPFAAPPPRLPTPTAAPRQRGFGILQAMLLIVLAGAAIVAGFTLLRATQPVDHVAQQEDALRWADEALVAYAAANARLPCPVTSPTSAPTACVGAGQKGWLPVRALEAVHPGGARPSQPMRYVVYGGGPETNLAERSNTFSPARWDGTAHNFGDINGLDLCAKLVSAARETIGGVRTDRARAQDATGAAVNIAFGIVAPGPTAGLAGRFDGVNQGADAVVAAPSMGTRDDHDDRTRVRSFDSLGQSLGCGFADPANPDGLSLAALDMLALAVDVSDEAAEQHASNQEDTALAVAMAGVATAFAGINVALAGASIANSVSTLATASAQLSAAIASCVVLVGCGLIPPYTAAVVAAKIAIGLAATATGLAAAAVIPTALALDATIVARDMAQQGLPSATIDLSAATQRTCQAAEGGFIDVAIDANGNLVTIHPPQFRPGLLQEAQATEAELEALRVELETTRLRIVELEQIPSLALIEYPDPPVRRTGESDADFEARRQQWLDTRRDQEAMLQTKLEAIRVAMNARFDYDRSRQQVSIAENELATMVDSVTRLSAAVDACATVPASDIVGSRRCASQRRSLQGLTACDVNILTAAQVLDRQCLPWKTADRDAAIAARDLARVTFLNAEDAAARLPEPPIKDYISNVSPIFGILDCTVFSLCDPLIIPGQRDTDKRETYAKTVYKHLGLLAAIDVKVEEAAAKRASYDTAMAQCETLRNLQAPGGASGSQVAAVWAGATAIMQAANCRGATGAVQPATCGSTP